MSRRTWLVSIGIAVGVAGAPRQALAYARFITDGGAAFRWHESCVAVTPSTNPSPDLSADEIAVVARRSLEVWSRDAHPAECSYLQLSLRPASASARVVRADGVNSLIFRQDRWCRDDASGKPSARCYDPAALALTSIFLRDSPGKPDDGRILDADVEVNGVNFRWADITDESDPRLGTMQDLGNTLTHEFGHLIGLDHNCYAGGDRPRGNDHLGAPLLDCATAPPELRDVTMFASASRGDLGKRTLHADDIMGVCEIYPAERDPKQCRGVDFSDGGCGVAGRRLSPRPAVAALGLPFVLVVLALVRRRRPSIARRLVWSAGESFGPRRCRRSAGRGAASGSRRAWR